MKDFRIGQVQVLVDLWVKSCGVKNPGLVGKTKSYAEGAESKPDPLLNIKLLSSTNSNLTISLNQGGGGGRGQSRYNMKTKETETGSERSNEGNVNNNR